MALRTRLEMSWSYGGRHSFMYSTTVTSLPRLLKIEANSSPITPAPTMHRRLGRASMSSNPVEVTTPGRSMPGMGSILEREPVATMMLSAVYSSPSTSTLPTPCTTASPHTRVMPGWAMSVSTSWRNLSTTVRLRSMILPKSTAGRSPQTLAAASTASASWHMAFVGMQPQLRQVPPTSPFSITTTLRP